MDGRNSNSKDEKRPTNFRQRNLLNVVVEKVGATRAMVRGDVSVESLKELLMSSLSLLPAEELSRVKKLREEARHSSEDIGKGGRDSKGVSERTGEEKSKGRLDRSGIESPNDKRRGNIEARSKTVGKDFLADVAAARKFGTKSAKGGKQGRGLSSKFERPAGSKRRRYPKEGKETENEGENQTEELLEALGSLPSCSSISGSDGETLPLSCDGRWLCANFRAPLILALRDIANKNPQDPIEYLGFWLRNYRSVEEKILRQREFDNDLKSLRNTNVIPTINVTAPVEYPELEFSIGEEGGGNADENFRNYHPSTPAF